MTSGGSLGTVVVTGGAVTALRVLDPSTSVTIGGSVGLVVSGGEDMISG